MTVPKKPKRKVSTTTKQKRALKERQQRELWEAYKAGKVAYTFSTTAPTVASPITPPTVTSTKLKNYLMLVVDESGSMATLTKQTIDSVNENLNAVRAKAGRNLDVEVSIHKFGGRITHDKVMQFKPLQHVGTFERYSPENSTPLYDAIGFAIDDLKARPDINDPNTSVLVVIVTDGCENASSTHNARSIGQQVAELQNTKRWTFTVSGANINLTRFLPEVPMGNKAAFTATAAGMQRNTVLRNSAIGATYASYSKGQTQVQDFYDAFPEEKKASEAGKAVP